MQLLEKILKEHGIERKLVGSNEYKDVNEYKEKGFRKRNSVARKGNCQKER